VRQDHPDPACRGLAPGARHPRSCDRRTRGNAAWPEDPGDSAQSGILRHRRRGGTSSVCRRSRPTRRWVLCDRFSDATSAYQGFGRGLDAGFIRTLNAFSAQALKPDLTFLFDLPVEVGLARAEKRAAGGRPEAAEDRFEREERTFHGRIREGYLSLAAEEPERFRIINGAADVETVRREVCRHLTALL